ncbi:hypothetical protein R6Q59_031043, partial [Mikania micrantha]
MDSVFRSTRIQIRFSHNAFTSRDLISRNLVGEEHASCVKSHYYSSFTWTLKSRFLFKSNGIHSISLVKTAPNLKLIINLPSHEKVPSVGSSTPKEPKSPWMPFSMLFEAISTKVAPTDLKLLHAFYEFFR